MMAEKWQKVVAERLFCHWWQDAGRHMIAAMTFLMILLAIAGVLSVATIVLMFNDGRGRLLRTPPASHVEDARFRAPGAVL